MALYNRVSKDCSECPLPDPEGPLSDKVSFFICAANLEVKPFLI